MSCTRRIRKIFSSKSTFAFGPKKILICWPVNVICNAKSLVYIFQGCHSAIWPLNECIFCILDCITGLSHIFNGIKEPEPSKIFPMFISSDVLGSMFYKQIAVFKKNFFLLKNNNKAPERWLNHWRVWVPPLAPHGSPSISHALSQE